MVIIIMGVVGAGKTTIGQLLARQLQWRFVDADSFHSPANVEKMRSGIPLDESDRIPWLDALHVALLNWLSQKQNVVLACSALKRSYRSKLAAPGVAFVYLRGTEELIATRLRARSGHYATGQLLESQFAILEEPEDGVIVDIEKRPKEIVSEIRSKLALP